MTWGTPKCPNCESTLHEMGVDFINAIVICKNCQQNINPEFLIDSSNVNYVAQFIPEEFRDEFLKKIGFERKSGNIIPKGILKALSTLIVLPIAFGFIIFAIFNIIQGKIIEGIWLLLSGCAFIVFFISSYKNATKLKWRKIKKNQ